ncbi:MAG: Arm DNA-binding domain-containing protein [Deferrisomatales bacterium]
MVFTDKVVRSLHPKATRYEVREDGRPGFGLRVAPTGRKTWVFVYRFDGKPKRMQFDTYPATGLADAHLEHAFAVKELEKNVDAGATKRARKPAPTVSCLVHADPGEGGERMALPVPDRRRADGSPMDAAGAGP